MEHYAGLDVSLGLTSVCIVDVQGGTIRSPTLLIRPVTSSSPDWYFPGLSPKCGPTSREPLKCVGSSTQLLKVWVESGHQDVEQQPRM